MQETMLDTASTQCRVANNQKITITVIEDNDSESMRET